MNPEPIDCHGVIVTDAMLNAAARWLAQVQASQGTEYFREMLDRHIRSLATGPPRTDFAVHFAHQTKDKENGNTHQANLIITPDGEISGWTSTRTKHQTIPVDTNTKPKPIDGLGIPITDAILDTAEKWLISLETQWHPEAFRGLLERYTRSLATQPETVLAIYFAEPEVDMARLKILADGSILGQRNNEPWARLS